MEAASKLGTSLTKYTISSSIDLISFYKQTLSSFVHSEIVTMEQELLAIFDPKFSCHMGISFCLTSRSPSCAENTSIEQDLFLNLFWEDTAQCSVGNRERK